MSFRYRGSPRDLVPHPLAGHGDGESFGAAIILGPNNTPLKIIFSSGENESDWEHVSVSCPKRVPNWREMCFAKELFWDGDDCVVQFHPPKADYINCHEFVLHLWRHPKQPFPMPPKIYV